MWVLVLNVAITPTAACVASRSRQEGTGGCGRDHAGVSLAHEPPPDVQASDRQRDQRSAGSRGDGQRGAAERAGAFGGRRRVVGAEFGYATDAMGWEQRFKRSDIWQLQREQGS